MSDAGRRRCPNGKMKYFNDSWAKIAAEQLSERLGSSFATYRCICGWWHVYDRSKKHANEQRREPRSARRRRAARGEPSPLQKLLENRRREKVKAKRLRQRAHKELPLRAWEDDGGACLWLSGP